jgi:AmmeMemoRadiSam system protein B/AmmeMemoRadiSam system protein A
MAGRIKKRILAEALVGAVIIAGVGLGLHLYGFTRLAAVPGESAPSATEHKTTNQPAGEEDGLTKPPKSVLRSALAGSWYPDDAEALKKQFTEFFEKADVSPKKDLIALVLPHAGYNYSGKTACAGLKTIAKQYKRIIVIGPSHSVRMEEVLSVPRVTHYETPLGQTPLDVEFIERLLQYPVFQNVPHAHKREHSVQIEVPLLQFSNSGFKLVPIVAGSCSLETIKRAAAILKSMVDEQTLAVASSDFVHYGASYGYVPFTENIPEQIKKLDTDALKLIEALDAPGFLEYRRKTGATICGYIPVAVLLSMLDESAEAELVEYATSGQMEGDYSRSVSYLSVAFSGTWRKGSSMEPPAHEDGLTDADKEYLINLAKKTISYALEHRKVPEVPELGAEINDRLKQPRAAFVTLKKSGQLRGCIGDIFPSQPLYKSVFSNALNAAFGDRRFGPLQKDEFDDIAIEISALTRPRSVPSSDKIRIGIDGVVLNKAGRSAVFLPQVAPEQGWDLNKTLTQLSMKAGLAADDWKQDASFLVFQADVFGEGEK